MTERVEAGKTRHWKLTRDCSMRPRSMAIYVLVIAAANAVVGGWFWVLGHPGVVALCVVEMLFIAAATWVHASHAVDGEHVQLDSESLRIETLAGGEIHIYTLHPAWVWLEQGEGSALDLRSGWLRIPVARHVSDVRRLGFIDEFSAMLAIARSGRAVLSSGESTASV